MKRVVGVGVADPGNSSLIRQNALDLGCAGVVEDARERRQVELGGERVGTERGDVLDVHRVTHDVDLHALLRPHLGDVEAGAVDRARRAVPAGCGWV